MARPTSTASCGAPGPQTCQCSSKPNSSWLSTSRQPRHSASVYLSISSFSLTRLSSSGLPDMVAVDNGNAPVLARLLRCTVGGRNGYATAQGSLIRALVQKSRILHQDQALDCFRLFWCKIPVQNREPNWRPPVSEHTPVYSI